MPLSCSAIREKSIMEAEMAISPATVPSIVHNVIMQSQDIVCLE